METHLILILILTMACLPLLDSSLYSANLNTTNALKTEKDITLRGTGKLRKIDFIFTLEEVKKVYRSYVQRQRRRRKRAQQDLEKADKLKLAVNSTDSTIDFSDRNFNWESSSNVSTKRDDKLNSSFNLNDPTTATGTVTTSFDFNSSNYKQPLNQNQNQTAAVENKRLLQRQRQRRAADKQERKPKNKGVHSDDVATDQACKILLPCSTDGNADEFEEMDNCLHWANDESPFADSVKRKCYNHDPEPLPLDDEFMKPLLMTVKTPENLNEGAGNIGFQIPEDPIYRHSQYFDIDGVGEAYKDKNGFTGYEFMDWPGEGLQAHVERMTRSQPLINENLGALRPCMQILEFQGKSDKYLDYICNTDEGLDISALGLIDSTGGTATDDDSEDKQSCTRNKVTRDVNLVFDHVFNLRCNLPKNREKADSKCALWPVPDGKMYLASGNHSLLSNYIQPLVVDEDILRRLAKDAESDEPLIPIPMFQKQYLHCNEMNSSDIRTVLDFAFASDRLILGMKCGVIIVKDINNDERNYDIAYLRSIEREPGNPAVPSVHKFPYMINTVAATPCCSTNKICRHLVPLVAIYSSYASYHTYPDDKTAILKDYKLIYLSLDNGDTFDQKIVSPAITILNMMYWMYVKIAKWQIKDARALDWIKEEVVASSPLGEPFSALVDPITKFVLQGVHVTDEEETDIDEEDCYEIVSMASVSEENLLLVLCKYRKKSPTTTLGTAADDNSFTYAIFSIPIRGDVPIIVPKRKSKRKFICKPMPRGNSKGNAVKSSKSIEPTIVRIPKSYSLFILGCEKTIYYSSNGGRTLFLTAFYYSDAVAPGDDLNYFRSYENKYLTSYPLVAVDPHGKHVVFTFGKYFAYGVISTNQEIYMISGPILEKLPDMSAGGKTAPDPTFIPYFDESARMRVAVIYINLLKSSGQAFFAENYKDHHSIRLLDTHVSIHAHSLPFYSESPDTLAGVAKHTIRPCKTFGFKINATSITMDIGESKTIRVSVKNNQKDLPLNVLLTHDKAANVNVSVPKKIVTEKDPSTSSSDNEILVHEWDITLTSKPYIIKRETAKIDAFFGSSYSNMEEVTSHLIISTEPQLRCHVQPRGHVSVRFGCSKYMVVHEDERRPQCDTFRDNFEYEIPEGHYDKDMANYWIAERPKFYSLKKGTLKIKYDYEMFGCPVQPYRLDDYIPDLRILNKKGSKNTTEGTKFMGTFILIEIFGASGYSFSKTVRKENCAEEPQTIEQMVEEWKVRVEAIKSVWFDYANFNFDAVFQPLNIWNRVNYKDCKGAQFVDVDPAPAAGKAAAGNEEEKEEDDDGGEGGGDEKEGGGSSADADSASSLGPEVLDSPYEVLTHSAGKDDTNRLVWDPHIRQQVYIFMAVSVDPYDSFCTYHTLFGVSLTVAKEDPDWVLMLVHFGTVLFLFLLLVAGYHCQKRRTYKHTYAKSMFNRLLTATWNLSFRYEHNLAKAKKTGENQELDDNKEQLPSPTPTTGTETGTEPKTKK